jgi:hypothetical protein
VRIDPTRLDRDSLGAAEVLVLDHPGKLPAEAMPLLASFLRRGRGILYVAAEPVDATNLKLLADATGSALQMPVEFVPQPAGLRRRDLFLNEIQRNQAPFNVFGDGLSGLIGPLRFSGGLASRRLEGGLTDDVVAAYSDRSACLVVTSCGAGALAVLNADLATSNLSVSPAFVPWIGELVGRLLGRQRLADAAACGEPLAVFLPASAGPAAGLLIIGPDGKSEGPGQLVEESGSVLWRSASLDAPGVYQVNRDNVLVFAVAAAIPAEESDLRPLDPGVFQGRLAGGRTIHYRSAASAEEKRDTLWIWLAVACVACMLGEVVALKAFRT